MKYRILPVLLIAFIVLMAGIVLVSGYAPVRLSDTHNTTTVINEYNTWADQQNIFNTRIQADLVAMNSNLVTFNREADSQDPDMAAIHASLSSDQQVLNDWGSDISTLDSFTSRFEDATGGLDLGNGTPSRESTDLLVQNMKIYTISLKNAQQHFVEYNYDMEQYIAAGDPDYWDESFREKAIYARDQGLSAINDGNSALFNITQTTKLLEQYQ